MVSSWLILQIASLFCSALGLPSWTLKAILALLLVGFGAALIIGSWIDLRAARLADAGPLRWSGKVHLVFWPLGTSPWTRSNRRIRRLSKGSASNEHPDNARNHSPVRVLVPLLEFSR